MAGRIGERSRRASMRDLEICHLEIHTTCLSVDNKKVSESHQANALTVLSQLNSRIRDELYMFYSTKSIAFAIAHPSTCNIDGSHALGRICT